MATMATFVHGTIAEWWESFKNSRTFKPRARWGLERGGEEVAVGSRDGRRGKPRTVRSRCQSRSCTSTTPNCWFAFFSSIYVFVCRIYVRVYTILSTERAHGVNTFYSDLARLIETWATTREARITRKKWHAPLSGIVYVLSAVRLREIELWKWQWTLVIKWTIVRSNFKWFKIVFTRDIHANSVNSYELLSRKLQKRKYWRVIWWLVIGVLVYDKRIYFRMKDFFPARFSIKVKISAQISLMIRSYFYAACADFYGVEFNRTLYRGV